MARTGSLLSTIHMVLRAAVWKSTPQPRLAGLPTLIVCCLAALAGVFVLEYSIAAPPIRFVPYGLNSSITSIALTLVVAALFVRPEGRFTALAGMELLSIPLNLVTALVRIGITGVTSSKSSIGPGDIVGALIFLAQLIWWGGAMFAVLRSVEPDRRFARLRTAGLWLALLFVINAMPYAPTFRGSNFDLRTTNLWEAISAARDGRFNTAAEPPPRLVNRAQVELAQPALLEAALTHLTPQVKGKIDIYTIGLAGSSDQDVFIKEMNGGLESLARVFALDGHVVRLANNFDTAKSVPVASRQNFAATVRAIAQVMDRDEDVLLLFMTSHGSNDGVSLVLTGAFYADLSPTDVAAVLDREGIKNRIVIVSACYSGIFLKVLANENTIVLTAADEKHPSFGCSNEREWTYFGDAFFNRSLRPGKNIEETFLDAKVAIAQWEARDRATPSNPQGYFGHALMEKLAPLYTNSGSKNAMILPGGPNEFRE